MRLALKEQLTELDHTPEQLIRIFRTSREMNPKCIMELITGKPCTDVHGNLFSTTAETLMVLNIFEIV